ncbi:MAG TPA: sigma-70 family RNA polymerase sigma factor [Solirubrobacteraceae bacterium]|nr:sigma-70 family RNA polymerase sigma factor [Solirubrobacteraceae bacterium]
MATRMFDRRPAAQDRVAAIVARHGELLTRVARGYSLCADDAQDAVQRALEIYMRRVDSLDPATELAWMKVVVKHEALAVRRGRASVAGEEIDLDTVPAVGQRSVEERLESAERVERAAEVMRRLKRDEARALMLKAEGLSYVEIGERLGWTYTKVNRCITEGRRRFMRLYEELETGAECERLAPTVAALAQGTATSEALLELRPHLRNCPGCRATVRALHASRLRRVTAFLPVALLAPARAFVERLRGPRAESSEPAVELRPMERQQELEEAFRRLNQGDVIAPSVAEGVGRLSTVRINARGWIETALQRLQSSDVALGVHAATAGGGGRITSIAALIGICVSGVGAGTYCVATVLLPDPKPAILSEERPKSKRKDSSHATGSASRARKPSTKSSASIQDSRPAQRTTPTRPARAQPDRHRNKPVQGDEFSFETSQAALSSQRGSVTRSGNATGTAASNGTFESGESASPGPSEFADGTGGEFSP